MAEEPDRSPNGPLRLLCQMSVMMFGQYMALGMWIVTVGTYIAQNTAPAGLAIFGSWFVGVAAVSSAVGALVSPIVFGSLADGMFSSQRLLSVANIGCALSLVLIATADSQGWFFVGMLAYYQFAVPTMTLTNSIALRQFDNPTTKFPIARAVGTGGWIVAMIIVGSAAPVLLGVDSIEASTLPMWLSLAVHLAMAAYCLTLPHTPPLATMVNWRSIATSWAELLSREPRIGRFLLVAFVATIAPQFCNVYLNANMNQIQIPGAASRMSLGQFAEIFVILSLPALVVAIGPKRTFFIGLLAWSVRYGLLCFGGDSGWPFAMLMTSIALHGFCYAYVYISGFLYVDRIAPPEFAAVAQGMFAMATSGLGHLIGSLASGGAQAVYLTPPDVEPQPYNWPMFWAVALVISTNSIVVFWLTMGLRRDVYDR